MLKKSTEEFQWVSQSQTLPGILRKTFEPSLIYCFIIHKTDNSSCWLFFYGQFSLRNCQWGCEQFSDRNRHTFSPQPPRQMVSLTLLGKMSSATLPSISMPCVNSDALPKISNSEGLSLLWLPPALWASSVALVDSENVFTLLKLLSLS